METTQFKVSDAVLASKGQRLGNYIIDVIVLYICIIVVGATAGFIIALTGHYEYQEWIENVGNLDYVVFTAFMIPYYTFFESYKSRTIAKYITKTMVVMEDGSRPDYWTTFKRSLCRIIPFDGLTILMRDRGLHDSIPNTYVVKKEAFERERELFYSFQEIGQPQAE